MENKDIFDRENQIESLKKLVEGFNEIHDRVFENARKSGFFSQEYRHIVKVEKAIDGLLASYKIDPRKFCSIEEAE